MRESYLKRNVIRENLNACDGDLSPELCVIRELFVLGRELSFS